MNSAPSNPRYELIAEAANTVKTELSLFANEHISDSDTDTDSDDNNSNKNQITPADLEHEILFLRSSLEYFYSHSLFPFNNPTATRDFTTNFLPMAQPEYQIMNQRMKNRYKKRVWKICNKFQLLENPREQDAFELGNRIWGGMSLEMIRLNQQGGDDDETMDSAEEEDKKDDDDDKEKNEEGGDDKGKGVVAGGGDDEVGLGKFPLLKKAFSFKNGIIRMPVVSKKAVEKGLVALGEDRVKEWEERWKTMEISALKNFLAKVSMIRHCAITVLDQLQEGDDSNKKTTTYQGADQGR